MHPRHVADREIRIQAQSACAPGSVVHTTFPQLHRIVGGQRNAQLHHDIVVAHPPAHIVLAGREFERLRLRAHRLVRHRVQRAGVFVLEIEKPPRMMRVVRLLGHHEIARFQHRRMRVFRWLRLHELAGGITAAGQLHHHAAVPQEAAGIGHCSRAVERIARAIGAGRHQAGQRIGRGVGRCRHGQGCSGSSRLRAASSCWMRFNSPSSSG